jgi:hypothetical protein
MNAWLSGSRLPPREATLGQWPRKPRLVKALPSEAPSVGSPVVRAAIAVSARAIAFLLRQRSSSGPTDDLAGGAVDRGVGMGPAVLGDPSPHLEMPELIRSLASTA